MQYGLATVHYITHNYNLMGPFPQSLPTTKGIAIQVTLSENVRFMSKTNFEASRNSVEARLFVHVYFRNYFKNTFR